MRARGGQWRKWRKCLTVVVFRIGLIAERRGRTCLCQASAERHQPLVAVAVNLSSSSGVENGSSGGHSARTSLKSRSGIYLWISSQKQENSRGRRRAPLCLLLSSLPPVSPCPHHAFVQSSGSYVFIVPFVQSARRRSNPRQGVLGLSLSRRNEGLGVGSR